MDRDHRIKSFGVAWSVELRANRMDIFGTRELEWAVSRVCMEILLMIEVHDGDHKRRKRATVDEASLCMNTYP